MKNADEGTTFDNSWIGCLLWPLILVVCWPLPLAMVLLPKHQTLAWIVGLLGTILFWVAIAHTNL
jgi:hypothetical protein